MAVLIVVKSCMYLAGDDVPPIDPVLNHPYSLYVMQAIPIIVYSYGCSVQVIPVFDELADRSLKQMHKVIFGGVGISFLLYVGTGLFGYLEFRGAAKGNILTNYPHDDVMVIVGRLLIAFGVALGFPMSSWPFRNTLEQFYFFIRLGYIPKERIKVSHAINFIETLAIMLCALTVAILIPNLSFIFGLLGSTSSMLLGFIIPAFIYLKLLPDMKEPKPRLRLFQAIFVLAFGLIIGVMGTVTTVILGKP